MDSATIEHRPSKRRWELVIFMTLVFLFLLWRGKEGGVSEFAMLLDAKARLAYEGIPPRFENVARIAPFLPYSFVFFFQSAWIAQAFLGAIALVGGLFLWFPRQSWKRWICGGGLLLFPPSLFLLGQRGDLCLLLFLLLLSLDQLVRLKLWGHPLALIGLGICFGALSLSYLSGTWLAILFFPLVFRASQRAGFSGWVGTLIAYFPLAFLTLVDGTLEGIYGPVRLFPHFFNDLSVQSTAFKWSAFSAVLLPCLIAGVLGGALWWRFREAGRGVVALLPLWVGGMIATGTFEPHPWKIGTENRLGTLDFTLLEKGRVLLDDESFPDLVLALPSIHHLILPYQHSFSICCSSPENLVDIVIVDSHSSKDRVAQRISGSGIGEVEGMDLLFDEGGVKVYHSRRYIKTK